MLQVQNLNYHIGNRAILQNVSATFSPHQITGIIGCNGSGKSTLLSFLSRIRTAPHTITYQGQDITTIEPKLWARHVACLPQDVQYQYNLSVLDVTVMGRFPHKAKWSSYTATDYQLAQEALDRFAVGHLAEQNIQTVSGGERQRIAIAKVFAQETPIILLDEPTNHLDAHHIITLLQTLRASRKTVIMVMHDLSLARQYCDSILLLHQGRCITQGPANEVLVPSTLNPIFGVSFVEHTVEGTTWLHYR